MSGVTYKYGDDGRSDVACAVSDQMILTAGRWPTARRGRAGVSHRDPQFDR
jgi:hypothetical protein